MIVDRSGFRLAVRVDGPETAPPILMINSLGTTAAMWEPQLPALAARYRVVRYDTRGHGGSTAPPGLATIDDLGRDALAVLDHLGLARCHVCGLSLGGMTGMWLGAHAPARVDRLVLANSAPWVPPPELWTERITLVAQKGLEAVADGVLARWLTDDFRRDHPDVAARLREIFLANDPEGYAACCAAVRDLDLRPALPSIRASTLVIAGSEDLATPLAASEAMTTAIPDARLVVFRAAHLSNWECVEPFRDALLSFLSE